MKLKYKLLTGYTINNDKSSISNSQSGCHFTGEVNVSGGVDQVDQETTALVSLLLDGIKILLVQLIVQRDGTKIIIQNLNDRYNKIYGKILNELH